MIDSLPFSVQRLSRAELDRLVDAIVNKEVTFGKYLGSEQYLLTSFISLLYTNYKIENLDDISDVYQYNDQAKTSNIYGNLVFETHHVLHVDDDHEIAERIRKLFEEEDPRLSKEDLAYYKMKMATMQEEASSIKGLNNDDWDV